VRGDFRHRVRATCERLLGELCLVELRLALHPRAVVLEQRELDMVERLRLVGEVVPGNDPGLGVSLRAMGQVGLLTQHVAEDATLLGERRELDGRGIRPAGCFLDEPFATGADRVAQAAQSFDRGIGGLDVCVAPLEIRGSASALDSQLVDLELARHDDVAVGGQDQRSDVRVTHCVICGVAAIHGAAAHKPEHAEREHSCAQAWPTGR
jgi:hypothetical protein